MALDSVHPEYADMLPEWQKMRDTHKGERRVKDAGPKYLPPTKGMRLDGYGSVVIAGTVNAGQDAYDAYKMRAVMPDYVRDAVEVFIGLLHSQPTTIELPDRMEPLREKITMNGESMDLLLRRINAEQLITGRLGLLLDLPTTPDPTNPMPYIALYVAEAARNWDDGEINEGQTKLNLVVLDESGYRRNSDFQWDVVAKYRVLQLGALQDPESPEDKRLYSYGVFETTGQGVPEYVSSDMKEPAIRGTPLDVIPFVFVNPSDITATPDDPPLTGLANLALTIYRGEADYRQNLFMQGQDTLVVKGDIKGTLRSDPNELKPARGNVLNSDQPLRTGAGSMIHLDADPGAGAEYIGVNSQGLAEQRTALENDRERAEAKAGALSTKSGGGAESGDALETRVAARTASLNQIAKTGAAALEWLLKVAAKWMGEDPEKVKVTPNLEFADTQLDPLVLSAVIAAKQAGAPVTWETVHRIIADGGITEFDYETEKAQAEAEKADMIPPGTNAGGNPNDPNAPPAQNTPPAKKPVKAPAKPKAPSGK
jgi:hypothetical protein